MQHGRLERFLTGPAIAAAILAVFWVAMLASLKDKSLGFDEILHATAGYGYWRYGDYGLQPENGNLPQRLAGLPLALGSYHPLPTNSQDWRESQAPYLGYTWFYELGNNAQRMVASGRAACGLLAVLLGAVVWAWARSLFGPRGGLLSLLLYALNPTILANGALMTSDMAAALFFMAASWSWAAVLGRMSAGRVLGSAVLVGCLFVSKASAVLFLPMMAILATARLADGRPLEVFWRGRVRTLRTRARQGAAVVLAGAVHALAVAAVIWASYGFRYAAFPPGLAGNRFVVPWEYVLEKPDPSAVLSRLDLTPEQFAQAVRILQEHGVAKPIWTNGAMAAISDIRGAVLTGPQDARLDILLRQPPAKPIFRAIDFFRQRRLLPEAWLYGLANVLRQSAARRAFWNGQYRETGWPGFFPYTFLIKTPLALFGICGLALAAACAGRGPRSPKLFARTLPLWTLLAVYWSAAVASHLNIGHRHILPVYAPMLVLCGGAARWFGGQGGRRWPGWLAGALVAVLAVETVATFPNYLAYFNGLVRPDRAYRHLIDSSLDWGQELPAVQRYIDAHPAGRPYYLSYFGEGSPAYFKVHARLLYSYGGPYLRGSPDLQMVKVPADAGPAVAALRRKWPGFDLMGVGQAGADTFAVFLKKASELKLEAGTYLISASMLQPVYYEEARGPWNSRYEATYRELAAEIQPLLGTDPAGRQAAFQAEDPRALGARLGRFEQYRFARLTSFLRQREPDGTINHGILIYRLTDADLSRALDVR